MKYQENHHCYISGSKIYLGEDKTLPADHPLNALSAVQLNEFFGPPEFDVENKRWFIKSVKQFTLYTVSEGKKVKNWWTTQQ